MKKELEQILEELRNNPAVVRVPKPVNIRRREIMTYDFSTEIEVIAISNGRVFVVVKSVIGDGPYIDSEKEQFVKLCVGDKISTDNGNISIERKEEEE